MGTGCCYCKGEHPPDTCNIVRSVKDRKQSLRAAGRCYVCLRVGHLSRNCRSRARCHQCGGRHHNSICEGSSRVDSVGVATSNSPGGQNRAGSTGGLNPSAPPFGSGSTACCCVGSKNNVLLQTAQATAYDPSNPYRQRTVTILFNSGSQRSYVTEEVNRFLNLKSKGQKSMTIMTFGSKKPEHVTCERVEIGVAKDGVAIQLLSAFTVPMI